MKIFFFCFFLFLALLAGCAVEKPVRLPDLDGVQDTQGEHACAAVFPQGNWQFVHSIDFTMKNGAGTTVIGVTNLAGNQIECALVTVEGLTLFSAVSHGKESFEVRRAVPPFDNPEFAQGLIGDIRAIFLPPPGNDVQTGQLAGKTSVCRYKGVGGRVVDVLLEAGDCWQIKSYSSDLIMKRSIVGRSCRKNGPSYIPEYLLLKTSGQTGYTLKMALISADNIK